MRVAYALIGLVGLVAGGCYSGIPTGAIDSAGDSAPTEVAPEEDASSGSGTDGGSDGGEEPPAGSCAGAAARLPPTVRGLNSRQFAKTVGATFPGVEAPTDLFWDSDRSSDYSTRATIRRLDFKSTSELIKVAETISIEAANVLLEQNVCLQEVPAAADCVHDVLATTARKLYRAPAPAEHLEGLQGLFDTAAPQVGTEVALRFALRAMLNSPRFLFRTELGVAAPDGTSTLTPHEVAAALSYTLTDAPPDAQLRAAADEAQLDTPAQLRAHAQRLLASEAGARGMLSFVAEFTGIINFALIQKDEAAFPGFTDELKQAMQADFEATVEAILRSPEPTLERLLTSDEFVISDLTAQYLGWGRTSSSPGELVPVDEPQRRGLLTHPAMLATYAHEVETNPVARGHFVSGELLCFTIPPPPEDVSFPDRDEEGANETLRETLERIHSVDACASCHALMDPFGWPFEVFDAAGRVRELDRGLPVDPSSDVSIPGGYSGPIDGAAQLLDVTAESDTAHVCVSRSVFSYVSGHGPDAHEDFDCINEELADAFVSDGDLPAQFVRVLSSPQFLERAE